MCQKVVNTAGEIFSPGGGNLRKSDFDDSKIFVNTEHQLKSKLAWSVSQKSMKLKPKMVQEQWLQLKMTVLFFYWVELTFVWIN